MLSNSVLTDFCQRDNAEKQHQHQVAEQWAKNRALMHSNSHTKILTVLTIDLFTAPGIVVHALDEIHGPFIHAQAPHCPPQHLSWHMIWGIIKGDKDKIKLFVGGGNALLLQKIAPVVPLQGTKVKCIWSMFNIGQMKESGTHCSSFMA